MNSITWHFDSVFVVCTASNQIPQSIRHTNLDIYKENNLLVIYLLTTSIYVFLRILSITFKSFKGILQTHFTPSQLTHIHHGKYDQGAAVWR